jgi:hypothetical protein
MVCDSMTKEQLLNEIDAFLLRHEMTDYALGKQAADDGHLIRRLRDTGLDPRLSTVIKIKKKMAELDAQLVNGHGQWRNQ